MDAVAEQFVTYTSGITFNDLTPSAIHAAKRSLVDSIGCALGAFQAEPIRALRGYADQVTSKHPSLVIGTAIKSTPDFAGFVNGAMVRYADFSDDYLGDVGMGPHPSDNIGSVMAAVSSIGGNGKALLLGMVVAYEAVGQIVDQVVLGGKEPTWDYPILHAIASSLACSRVFGLSEAQIRHALAIATVSNISLIQVTHGELSNWKGLRGPNGSRNGIFAALLARQDITGPMDPFEGRAGLLKHLNQTFRFPKFGGGGTPFKIEGTFFKNFPVRYNAQPQIEAALQLRKNVKAKDVKSLTVHAIGRYASSREKNPEYWNPLTRETADHSLPYLVGAALVDGEIADKTFTPERFRAPEILSLLEKITMVEDKAYTAAAPKKINCRIEAVLTSGETVSVHQGDPKGHPQNPMSDDDINQKFLTQATKVLPRSQADGLLSRLWKVEQEDRLEDLMSATVVR
jgi:2-methylcitrate dehydratase